MVAFPFGVHVTKLGKWDSNPITIGFGCGLASIKLSLQDKRMVLRLALKNELNRGKLLIVYNNNSRTIGCSRLPKNK